MGLYDGCSSLERIFDLLSAVLFTLMQVVIIVDWEYHLRCPEDLHTFMTMAFIYVFISVRLIRLQSRMVPYKRAALLFSTSLASYWGIGGTWMMFDLDDDPKFHLRILYWVIVILLLLLCYLCMVYLIW